MCTDRRPVHQTKFPARPQELNLWRQGVVENLGLILYSTLRWKLNVDLTIVKATKALMVCNRLAGISWGCKPRIIRWKDTMVVRPITTYGAVAQASKATQTSVGLQLSKLQRLACTCASGAMKALCDKTTITLIPRDSITKTVNFTRKFKVTLDSKADWNDYTIVLLRDSTIKWNTEEQISATCRILHFPLYAQEFNMDPACANCRFCDMEPETLEHLLIDWTAVCRRRIKARIGITSPGWHPAVYWNYSMCWCYVNRCDRGHNGPQVAVQTSF